ncbi:hypothetical protein [Rhizobium laguerreae]|uniref:hypothetical protein n=1 Tax=Rhizobium laguerreae TaxID=1076926 RepID=UPI001C914B6E|nr:hypothetical protein [Rhizobium laguerreae]MBY3036956.1 hypothetical protein [Rhizobium laguerreae]
MNDEFDADHVPTASFLGGFLSDDRRPQRFWADLQKLVDPDEDVLLNALGTYDAGRGAE